MMQDEKVRAVSPTIEKEEIIETGKVSAELTREMKLFTLGYLKGIQSQLELQSLIEKRETA